MVILVGPVSAWPLLYEPQLGTKQFAHHTQMSKQQFPDDFVPLRRRFECSFYRAKLLGQTSSVFEEFWTCLFH
jgi:hypothetical protein